MRTTIQAFIALILTLGIAEKAQATDGILLVGTPAEVKSMLKGTKLNVQFKKSGQNDLVAVRLEGSKVHVYEGEPVKDIVRAVGKVVKGGMVFVLTVGSEFWNFLNTLVGEVIEVGRAAMQAAIHVLTHVSCIIVDSVTWAIETTRDILRCVGDFIAWLLRFPH